jgi:hypothetical protein
VSFSEMQQKKREKCWGEVKKQSELKWKIVDVGLDLSVPKTSNGREHVAADL